jgi:uncharacterized protein
MDSRLNEGYWRGMSDTPAPTRETTLLRIAEALERLAPPPPPPPAFTDTDAFVWNPGEGRLLPVPEVNRVEIGLLKGIDLARDLLLENTLQFGFGHAANNALLWGARGMGKSSLVKAAHADVNDRLAEAGRQPLKLVEIHREDIDSLPRLMQILRAASWRFLLFCDDLSFDSDDSSYKALKAALDGGIEGRPANVLFYATSNRRHLMPRDMIDNERATAINPGEAVEEKVSLSDRFGLWLGFHNSNQDQYLGMVEAYAEALGLHIAPDELRARAIEWSRTRASLSGRTAWQFIQHLAGRLAMDAGGA